MPEVCQVAKLYLKFKKVKYFKNTHTFSTLISCNYFIGATVVTTSAHAHYVVTEFGVASLFGKSLRQRAHALINIAHPDHREWLEKEAFNRLKVMPSA